MTDSLDHDLLVKLDTKVEFLIKQQTDFIERYETRHTALLARVAALENKDSRDSEKVSTITKDVQESLANSKRISEAFGKLENFEKRLDSISGTSKLWDILIAVGATAAFLATLLKP